ncbi:MAG: thioredoxin [Defluviitaleaceae bacterium]|nr:thioredoxin [Defluviitaleaceae bacterium]
MVKLVAEGDFQKEVLESGGLSVVDFYADWCGPCKIMLPILDEVAAEVGEGVKIFKVNVDEAKAVAVSYGIRSIPALIFFKDGEMVDKAVGVLSKADLIDKINPHL